MENLGSYLEFQVTIEDNTLISKGFPEGRITVDESFNYVDGETFIRYEVARCEIHLYAEADESGRILRLYWFQFEGYLPSVTQEATIIQMTPTVP